MIITNILGGLGNQMFQYAAGRALSLRLSAPLRLDVSGFAGYGLHQGFELPNVFVCKPQIATKAEIRDLLGWRASRLARRILMRPSFAPLQGSKLAIDPRLHYWSGIRDISHSTYLAGYWQSEKYFNDVSDTIRNDFCFRGPLSKENSALAASMDKTIAISMHVRRGDYVEDPKTLAAHGLCSLDYYHAAVMHIAAYIQRPEFFIFSDDIKWVRENLKLDFPSTYVNHNHGVGSYNDMRLMSLCRHHIIANSSFSWWAAWLNPNFDKIVVAPKKWFANGNNAQDLLPVAWVKL